MVGYWRASGPIAPDAPPAYVACTPERFISHNPDYSCERMEGWSILEVGWGLAYHCGVVDEHGRDREALQHKTDELRTGSLTQARWSAIVATERSASELPIP